MRTNSINISVDKDDQVKACGEEWGDLFLRIGFETCIFFDDHEQVEALRDVCQVLLDRRQRSFDETEVGISV